MHEADQPDLLAYLANTYGLTCENLAEVDLSTIEAETPTAGDDECPIIAWVECESCGRIENAAHDFNYPADMAEDTQFFVCVPRDRCGRQAKLHFRRELKPAH